MSKTRYRLIKLAGYTKKAAPSLLLGLLATGLVVTIDLYLPTIVATLLDDQLLAGIGAVDPPYFMRMILLYAFLVAVISGLRFLSTYMFQRGAHQITYFMRDDLFKHVQTLPISFFDLLPAGKVVSRISNDTKDVQVLFQVVLSNMLTALLYLVGIYTMLFLVDPGLGLIGLIPLPIMLVILWDYKKRSNRYNQEYRTNLSALNASLNENIQGMEIIQSFNKEDHIYDEFSEISGNIYKAELKITHLEAYSSHNAFATLRYIILGLALLYFGYGHLTGRFAVTLGSFYIFNNYMMRIFDQAINIITRLGQLERANVASDHIFTLMREPATELDGREPVNLRGDIAFKDLNFSYKDDNYVLRDINLNLKAGTTTAFVGHTGSGKSTMMNLLLRFYDPQVGAVLIDGKPLSELPLRGYRENVAIVLQDPYLFKGTLLSNITLNDPRISREAAEKAFLEVGGEALLHRLPQGLDTEVREKGASFSSGERQLISFARALAKDPAILVLDEATANIDSETEKIIQQGIEKLKKGRTTLLIAHRLSTVKHADLIVVLDAGVIVEQGTHQELIEKEGQYQEMYLHQSN